MPKLTKRIIDSTESPESGQVFLRDDEISGFGLRFTRGSKTFILEKRIHGRMRRMTIGPYGPLTLDQARAEANVLIGRIAKGEDPATERVERKREVTFGDFKKEYEERHLPRKLSAADDRRMLENHLSGWNNRKLSSISRNDVALLHGKIGKVAPYAANRTVELLRKMFNLAESWGLSAGENPAKGIERFPEEKRDRFIKPEELPTLVEAAAQEKDIYIKASVMTLLLTGARKNEVLKMKWSDLDLAEGTWRKPRTKAGRPHLLPLPKPLIAMFMRLPRFDGNEYVFPSGRKKGGHLVGLQKAWERIRERAGEKDKGVLDIRLHDLRRTTGSWMVMSGRSLPMIGQILDHSQQRTTQIYARFALDPVREALDQNAQQMVKIGKLKALTRVKK